MSGSIEFGKCDICGKNAQLNRKYYHYDIQCECCSPNHFDLICHCDNCHPKPPKQTTIKLKVYTLKELRKEKLTIIEENAR